jgi:hypothetical protein
MQGSYGVVRGRCRTVQLWQAGVARAACLGVWPAAALRQVLTQLAGHVDPAAVSNHFQPGLFVGSREARVCMARRGTARVCLCLDGVASLRRDCLFGVRRPGKGRLCQPQACTCVCAPCMCICFCVCMCVCVRRSTCSCSSGQPRLRCWSTWAAEAGCAHACVYVSIERHGSCLCPTASLRSPAARRAPPLALSHSPPPQNQRLQRPPPQNQRLQRPPPPSRVLQQQQHPSPPPQQQAVQWRQGPALGGVAPLPPPVQARARQQRRRRRRRRARGEGGHRRGAAAAAARARVMGTRGWRRAARAARRWGGRRARRRPRRAAARVVRLGSYRGLSLSSCILSLLCIIRDSGQSAVPRRRPVLAFPVPPVSSPQPLPPRRPLAPTFGSRCPSAAWARPQPHTQPAARARAHYPRVCAATAVAALTPAAMAMAAAVAAAAVTALAPCCCATTARTPTTRPAWGWCVCVCVCMRLPRVRAGGSGSRAGANPPAHTQALLPRPSHPQTPPRPPLTLLLARTSHLHCRVVTPGAGGASAAGLGLPLVGAQGQACGGTHARANVPKHTRAAATAARDTLHHMRDTQTHVTRSRVWPCGHLCFSRAPAPS